MSHGSPQTHPDTTGEKLAFDQSQQPLTTPNNAFLGDIDEAEFNEDYENALRASMLTRMKSHMVQKMNDAVE